MPVNQLNQLKSKRLRALVFFGAAPPIKTAIKILQRFADSLHLMFPYLPLCNRAFKHGVMSISGFKDRRCAES
jgi:hypothetical protein